MRCVCCTVQREGIIVENGAPALSTGTGVGIGGCPGVLGNKAKWVM